MRATAIVALVLAVCLAIPASGAINPVLSYQGSLKDSSGAPYADGNYNFTFSIYDDSIGGVGLWSEIQLLEVKNGLIHAYLGSVTAFDQQIFAISPLWLGIRLGNDPEFVPRHVIGSTVYSFIAGNALQLEGYDASHFADSQAVDFAVSKHNADTSAHHPMYIDAAEIVSGTIAPERLPATAVDSSNINDGGIAGVDLADSLISSSKLQASAVTGIHLADGAVGSSKVTDGSLEGGDFQDSTITGVKIAAGSISAEHLSIAAFDGSSIVDGSLTGVDLADSTITGAKIAAGAIASTHLSGVAITGAQITDGTITGADISNASIGFNDIGPQQVAGYHIQDGSLTGTDIATSSVTGTQISDETITGNDIAINSIVDRHVGAGSVTSAKLLDEPGIAETTGGILTSVGTTVVNWMNVTVSAPAPGYILVFMHGLAQLGGNEAAQIAISTTPTGFEHFGEARVSSPTGTSGGNFTISISYVIPVAAASDVTVYGNVRASVLSGGVIDMSQGGLQAIYIRTGY